MLSRLLFFLESHSILSPPSRFSDGPLLIKFFILLSLFRMDLTNPSRALGRFWIRSTSLRLSTLSGYPPFFTNLFRLASLLALLVGLNLSFLQWALALCFKITEVAPLEVFLKNPFLALYFSLFSSIISLHLCLHPSAKPFMLTTWRLVSLPPRPLLRWRLRKGL